MAVTGQIRKSPPQFLVPSRCQIGFLSGRRGIGLRSQQTDAQLGSAATRKPHRARCGTSCAATDRAVAVEPRWSVCRCQAQPPHVASPGLPRDVVRHHSSRGRRGASLAGSLLPSVAAPKPRRGHRRGRRTLDQLCPVHEGELAATRAGCRTGAPGSWGGRPTPPLGKLRPWRQAAIGVHHVDWQQ